MGAAAWLALAAPPHVLAQTRALTIPDPATLRGPAPISPEIPVALLVDVSSGQHLFAREIDRRFMPASVTKVMTAFTAFRLIDEGRIDPATPFLISQDLEDQWSGEGSSMFLKAGERPTFGELLLGATTVSGNDACVAMALASTGSLRAWVRLMNRNAADLGMGNTHFGGANGFPDEGQTFTTARDLATLGSSLVNRYPGLYRRYFGHPTLTWRGLTQANHDPVTGKVAGGDGMKTGFTSEAGYTVIGSAKREGRRLIVVVAGSPTARLRDEAARGLLEWGFANFASTRVAEKGTIVGRARVQGGDARHVPLRVAQDLALAHPIDRGAAPPRMTIRYRGPLEAPISQGEVIASLHVEMDSMPAFDVPLEAAADVGEAGPLDRLVNGVAEFFS
ncbi:D-alanyl-D-alanine carboxypeptidase family protein [Alteraurantiacibacter buctensis]|uniref:D-alanyl-D-alanine carboxypeptidase family protein n=1 Tax=Alteraurantiacibacter buctensis TaxID=1503981 RepID=UPI00301E04ED